MGETPQGRTKVMPLLIALLVTPPNNLPRLKSYIVYLYDCMRDYSSIIREAQ